MVLGGPDPVAMGAVLGIAYRAIAAHLVSKAGLTQKTARTPAADDRLAKHSGFSLHAGVAAAADQRDKVERLCRYIARPAVATGRLALTAQGQVRYALKTPYRDGTTHVMFEPLEFTRHIPVPRPFAGSLRLCKSAVLPICHRAARRAGAHVSSPALSDIGVNC